MDPTREKKKQKHLRTLKKILDDAVKDKDLSKLEFADGYCACMINEGYIKTDHGFTYLIHSTTLEEHIQKNVFDQEAMLDLTNTLMEVIR